MKTLADIKRRCSLGAALTMTFSSWFPTGKLIGQLRVVKKVQTNGIAIGDPEDSCASWLYWPKAAEVRVTGPDTFDILLDGDWDKYMSYEFGDLS